MRNNYDVDWQRVDPKFHPHLRMLRSPAGLAHHSIAAYQGVLAKTAQNINGNGRLDFADGGRITREGIESTAAFLETAQLAVRTILEVGGSFNRYGDVLDFEEGHSPTIHRQVRSNLRNYGFDYRCIGNLDNLRLLSKPQAPGTAIFTIAPMATNAVKLRKPEQGELELRMGNDIEGPRANHLRDMLCARVSGLINGDHPYVFPLQPVTAVLAELHALNQ